MSAEPFRASEARGPQTLSDRELDAAVAVEVMGWSDERCGRIAFSEADAWDYMAYVVDAMREKGWRWAASLQFNDLYWATFTHDRNPYRPFGEDASLPRATCIAALEAVRRTK